MKTINSAVLSRGVQDFLDKRNLLIQEIEAEISILKVTNPTAAKKLMEGEKYLAANQGKSEVITTASGLQYQMLREGSGMQPMAGDTVEVNYVGTFIDGAEFDSSYKRGVSNSFLLNGVIKGWTEGLQLMSEGSQYRLFIPHRLAYGTVDRKPIPGGSVLIFDIELLKVKKAKIAN